MVKLKCVRYCHTTKQVKIPKICPVMTELSLLCVYFRFRGVWSHIPHYTGPEIKFTQFRQMNIVVKVILPVLFRLLSLFLL